MNSHWKCRSFKLVVMLVDDQRITGILLGKMLEDEPDFVLHTCQEPSQALEMAKRVQPSVILLDLVMPDIDGLTLLEHFRQEEEFKHLPIIMLSTQEEGDLKATAFSRSANDYLIKLPEKVEMVARLRYYASSYCNYMQMIEAERTSTALARRFKLVTQSVNEAIVTADIHGRITFWNWGAERLFGFQEAEILGQSLERLMPDRYYGDFRQGLAKAVETGKCSLCGRTMEFAGVGKDGSEFTLEVSLSMLEEDGKIIFVAVLRDITQRKEEESRIYHQATHDALTGLPNRHHFFNRLEDTITLAKRQNTGFALAFIDLDRFKWVNDTLGHAAGDELLRQVTRRLLVCLRKVDILARLGGDEFTAIFYGVKDPPSARIVAERILQSLNEPFNLDGHTANISGSLGITFFPNDGEDAHVLLRNADMAMYVAKNSGRNGYWFFQVQE
ncbi:MAG: diguanylate cyclase [Magnetococcales bacterium]|nr:diguanylate cyclase [Magnetococcales bacterium]NGZ26858.1 diguanylate cyclase [Magnetococcales bacterium]